MQRSNSKTAQRSNAYGAQVLFVALIALLLSAPTLAGDHSARDFAQAVEKAHKAEVWRAQQAIQANNRWTMFFQSRTATR